MLHIPVLQKEILEYLDPKPNENFIDCTVNGGGHSLAILERILPKGKLLGIDWSPELIKSFEFQISGSKVEGNVIPVCDNFANLKEIVQKQRFKKVSGILFDLGISSWHLAESGRGFSFSRKEPLDMRYNPYHPVSAEKILNYWSREEIEKILREYGEERFAREISEKIIEARKIKPIKNTSQLVEIVKRALPVRYLGQKINPATRTFQALRIAVNDELANLQKVLPQAMEVLERNGRTAVISFQSLEDRIVKNFFKEGARNNSLKILTKKPVTPTGDEIKINPRSRSAKLRAAIKTI
jgi:16S rRNA (cytosine1402-N4)-methyltransferase